MDVDHNNAVEKGVRDAWYSWITLHDGSTYAAIHDGVKDAVAEWLDRHGHEVFAPPDRSR